MSDRYVLTVLQTGVSMTLALSLCTYSSSHVVRYDCPDLCTSSVHVDRLESIRLHGLFVLVGEGWCVRKFDHALVIESALLRGGLVVCTTVRRVRLRHMLLLRRIRVVVFSSRLAPNVLF